VHAILTIAAGVVLLFVVAKGFFGSYWRAPPKREDSTATDWSPYGYNVDNHHGPTDHPT
jgi:hypothetical protein